MAPAIVETIGRGEKGKCEWQQTGVVKQKDEVHMGDHVIRWTEEGFNEVVQGEVVDHVAYDDVDETDQLDNSRVYVVAGKRVRVTAVPQEYIDALVPSGQSSM